MVLFRITENEPSKMHNARPYVYSRPCLHQLRSEVITRICMQFWTVRIKYEMMAATRIARMSDNNLSTCISYLVEV